MFGPRYLTVVFVMGVVDQRDSQFSDEKVSSYSHTYMYNTDSRPT